MFTAVLLAAMAQFSTVIYTQPAFAPAIVAYPSVGLAPLAAYPTTSVVSGVSTYAAVPVFGAAPVYSGTVFGSPVLYGGSRTVVRQRGFGFRGRSVIYGY